MVIRNLNINTHDTTLPSAWQFNVLQCDVETVDSHSLKIETSVQAMPPTFMVLGRSSPRSHASRYVRTTGAEDRKATNN